MATVRGRSLRLLQLDRDVAYSHVEKVLDVMQEGLGMTDAQMVAAVMRWRRSRAVNDAQAFLWAGDVVNAFDAGASITDIAEHTGIPRESIREYLTEQGHAPYVTVVMHRDPVRANAVWAPPADGAADPAMVEHYLDVRDFGRAYAAGLSSAQIGAYVGRSGSAVARWLREAGTVMRPSWVERRKIRSRPGFENATWADDRLRLFMKDRHHVAHTNNR
jgi:hypothetical protein